MAKIVGIVSKVDSQIKSVPDANKIMASDINIITSTINTNDDELIAETTRAITQENLKAPINSPSFTGTVSGVTKAMVSLGNADNTSDSNKPVSTAQATALALKLDKTSVNTGAFNESDNVNSSSQKSTFDKFIPLIPSLTTQGTGVFGKNLYNKLTMGTPNLGINNVGVVGTNNGWELAKIPVTQLTTYSFKHADDGYTPSQVGELAYLDSGNNILSTIDMSSLSAAGGLGGKTLTTPSNCVQIWKNVIVLSRNYKDTFQLELGINTTTYEAYTGEELEIIKINNYELKDIKSRASIYSIESNVTTLEGEVDSNTATLVEVNALKGDKPVVFADDTLNNNNPVTAGNTIISGKNFAFDVAVTKINIKAGNTVSNENVYVYVVNSSRVVTDYVGVFNGDYVANAIKTLTVNFNLPIGHRIAIITTALSLKYNSSDSTVGFQFGVDTAKINAIGETLIDSGLQNFTLGISLGFEGTYSAIILKEQAQKLGFDGNAVSGFQVSEATQPNEPARFSQITSNPLFGKKLYVTGDSMAKGHTTTASNVSYALISERNGMTYVNDGINGNFLTNGGGGTGTALVSRILSELDTDSDYVLINICTNDANNNVTLGAENSTNNAEIFGALNNMLQIVQTNAPGAKIGLITPYNRTTYTNTVVNAMVLACEKVGVPVFNSIKEGNLNWANTAQKTARTLGDGYHMNNAGHFYNSLVFENFLKTL